jgi:hypothetical protein
MVDFLSNKKERVSEQYDWGEGRGIACSVLCVQAIVPGEVPMRNWGKPKILERATKCAQWLAPNMLY